jgi:hypothetical protein
MTCRGPRFVRVADLTGVKAVTADSAPLTGGGRDDNGAHAF